MMASASLVEHKGTFLGIFFVLMYFMWMDVALYYNIQAREPTRPMLMPQQPAAMTMTGGGGGGGAIGGGDGVGSGAGGATTAQQHHSSHQSTRRLFSPFNGLTVKMMMIDPANHYIHTPAATIFNELTHFSTVLYFITPNMISVAHIIVAVVAAKFIASDTLLMRQVGVVLFELRAFLDCLDGVVYRAHNNLESNISNFGSMGYIIDGIADTAGSAALVVGVYIYLRRSLPQRGGGWMKLSLATCEHNNSSSSSCHHNGGSGGGSSSGGHHHHHHLSNGIVTHRRLLGVLGCFSLQLAISAGFWDRYISGYHQLLENPQATEQQMILQNEVLKSALMWIIMWFWRIVNAHALLEMILFSIFVDRLWEYLLFVQYIGFMVLIVLISLTEVHFHDVSNYIGKLAIPVGQHSSIISLAATDGPA